MNLYIFFEKTNTNFIAIFLKKLGLKSVIEAFDRKLLTKKEPLCVKLKPSERKELFNVFSKDIEKLEELIQKDLSNWKK
ncbi:MAG: hypothetical protein U5L10_00150 [Candidatus Moranbacteria bacterium]|nr:hypothetical protein [Candidatus Moranbacteria bacterium]